MVKLPFDVGSVIVSWLLFLVSLVVLWVRAKPHVELAMETLAEAQNAIKTGMSAMGKRSVEVRQERALERDIASDLMDSYPEIQALLEYLSPDLAEQVTENPEAALRVIERYEPLLARLGINLKGAPQEQKTWDF